MKVARRYVQEVRLQTNAVKCQRHLRGYLARKNVLKRRDYKCKVVRIQRFYKGRFRMKKRSAVSVQRMLRGYLCNRKVTKLMLISRGAQTLLMAKQKHEKRDAIKTLRRHAKVIRLQSFIRMRQQRKAYVARLSSIA